LARLIEACAGAGKTTRIVKEALQMVANGNRVLIITYTEFNQREIRGIILRLNGHMPAGIVIKGWYTFLLEDFIRPFQPISFERRVAGIVLNSSNPHYENGGTIPGRSAIVNGHLNVACFLNPSQDRAHSAFIAKLATEICRREKGLPLERLAAIYQSIFVDEVQDLVGWDFEVIAEVSKHGSPSLCCIGDFRQTVYTTAPERKKPRSSDEKVDMLKKLGFQHTQIAASRRSVQQICTVSDLVFLSTGHYPPTMSVAGYSQNHYGAHFGVCWVSPENANEYFEEFNPVILRDSRRATGFNPTSARFLNFGESKGATFDRTLILPTRKIVNFMAGDTSVFDKDRTETARSKCYVAITRARYSVCVLLENGNSAHGIPEWTP
jgi:DNA helicase-2/ATP-dependent DNA helicase PcrA